MKIADILLPFAVMLVAFALAGCTPAPVVGYDPATLRCRAWEDGKPTGPFLASEVCAGQPTPVVEP